MRKSITIIGPNAPGCTPEVYDFGLQLGKLLTDEGYIIINGGREGIMEAVNKGAHASARYRFGQTVCLLPSAHPDEANPYCDIRIPTGLGLARNFLIANSSDIVVAVAGGAGTLSEIAYAWQLNKKIIAVTLFDGWAKKLAGQALDHRRSDQIIPLDRIDDLPEILDTLLKSGGKI